VNYNWRVIKFGLNDQLNQDGALLENAIVEVQWKLTAEDFDGVTASYVGTTKLDAKNVSSTDFIALNDLTLEQVLGWVKDSIHPNEMDRINKQLDAKVERNRVRTIKPNW